jgi:hypothetical protein
VEFVPIYLLAPLMAIVPRTPTVTKMENALLVPSESVAEPTMDLQELMPMACLGNPFVSLAFARIVI